MKLIAYTDNYKEKREKKICIKLNSQMAQFYNWLFNKYLLMCTMQKIEYWESNYWIYIIKNAPF